EVPVAVFERRHCYLSPALGEGGAGTSSSDGGSATGVESGADGGVTSGDGAPLLDGGSFRGPLMPHDVNATSATQAIMAGARRRQRRQAGRQPPSAQSRDMDRGEVGRVSFPRSGRSLAGYPQRRGAGSRACAPSDAPGGCRDRAAAASLTEQRSERVELAPGG